MQNTSIAVLDVSSRRIARLIILTAVMYTCHLYGWLSAQTVDTGYSLAGRADLGSASTGGVNALYTGCDLDSDGYGEIIVQYGQSSNSTLAIYEAAGNDSYNEVWSVNLPGDNLSSDRTTGITVIDSDDDGNKEIGAGTTSSKIFYIYEMTGGALSANNPDATAKFSFTANGQIRAVVSGDLDNDGNGEYYIGNPKNTGSIEVIEASANDTWSVISLSPANSADIGDGIIALAEPVDLDGDGTLEIAVGEERGRLSIISFDGTRIDAETVNNNLTASSSNLELSPVVTFNLDQAGNPEIILATGISGAEGIYVFESTAADTYNRDKTGGPAIDFSSLSKNIVHALGAGDFDADNSGEIYYSLSDIDSLRYREFSGSQGSFTTTDFGTEKTVIAELPQEPLVMAIADNSGNQLLDGDQYRDMIVGLDGDGTGGYHELYFLESQTTDSSLPVTLAKMEAKVINGAVHLTWITESEVDNLGFLIHRTNNETGKTDLVADYRNDSRLQGQGNSSSQTVYTWADPFVSPGNTYRYILSDVDQTGTVTAHPDKSVTVSLPEMDSLLLPSLGFEIRSIAPNPFNPETAIEFVVSENLNQEPYTVTIVSLSGRMVQSITGNTHSGRNVVIWEGLDFRHQPVSSGIYLLSIQIGHVKQYRKLTVLK